MFLIFAYFEVLVYLVWPNPLIYNKVLDNRAGLAHHPFTYKIPCIYLFKVNNRNTSIRCGKCSQLTIKTSGHRSGVFVANFEHISNLFLCFYCWIWTQQHNGASLYLKLSRNICWQKLAILSLSVMKVNFSVNLRNVFEIFDSIAFKNITHQQM